MSQKTRKRLKVWSTILSISFFAVLFFLNIRIAFSNDSTNGDISLLGVDVQLFHATAAEDGAHMGPLSWYYKDGQYVYCCKGTDGSICGAIYGACQ